MYFLYNFFLISILIITSPFWIFKVLTTEKYRKGFFEKLLPPISPIPSGEGGRGEGELKGYSEGPCIHIHAVSVGEVIAAIPFIKELKKRHPEIRLVLSTVTPTGNEVARKRLPEIDRLVYFPFDLPWSVKRFVRHVKPDIYISVETELWPNFLREVKRSGAKSMIINGRISPKTFKGYSRIRPFMKRVLSNIDLFCMQSDEDARRIRAIGAPEKGVMVTGNMKYDQSFVNLTEEDLKEKRELLRMEKDDRVVIAGSTHRGEEAIIVESYKGCLKERGDGEDPLSLKGRAPLAMLRSNGSPAPLEKGGEGRFEGFSGEKLRLIIVPRHPERASEIEEIVRAQGLEPIKRTAFNNPRKDNIPDNPVIIVDTIGELAALYSLATVVIIGGSFIPHGGQNPIEALYYRKPVIFGPFMFNFREITEEMLKSGAGQKVERPEELPGALRDLLRDIARQREMGEKGYQIIQKNRGAVERTIAMVGKVLP